MEVILLLGPPGSGKGTLAQQLMQRDPTLRHVSTGDLLRGAILLGTPAGLQAAPIMKRGELVPDALIAEMLRDFLKKCKSSSPCSHGAASATAESRPPCSHGAVTYLLDGFPRTLAQATQLDSILAECGITLRTAILLEVPEAILLSRITGRRVCPACKNIHHIKTRPPKTEGLCDACNAALTQRPDDFPATVLRRLTVYNEATASLITHYAGQNLLLKIDADLPPDTLAENLLARLKAKG